MKSLIQNKRLIWLKLAFILQVASPFESFAQEFNVRMNVTSCSTFTAQMQCVDNASLPQNGDFIYTMNLMFASVNSFALSVSANYNGFVITSSGTAIENGYNVVTFSDVNNGQLTTTFNLNTWYDVASFTITSGASNIILTSTSETPTYYCDFICDSYFTGNENGVAANNGTLSKRWEGGTSTAWATAANWCPAGVPGTGENLTILNQTNDPVLSTSISLGNVEIQSGATLTLNGNSLTLTGGLSGTGLIIGSSTSDLSFSGTTSSTLYMDTSQWDTTNLLEDLTVNLTSGATLTLGTKIGVIGILTPTAGTITTGGNLRIRANTPTAYGQISPTGSGTISGNLTVQKALSNRYNGWRHIGLPVVATINMIDSFPVLDSNHTVLNEKNIKYWDAEPVTGFTPLGWTLPDSTFDNTRGYALYGGEGVLTYDSIWSVTGTIVTGNQNRTVYYNEPTGTSGADDNGWNLIANPYASNLAISTMWNTAFNNLTYKAIHIYDQINDQYFAMTAGGVTIITSGGASGTALSSTVIAPFQAFWVKTASNTTVNFTNSDRTTSATGLGTFMKNGNDLARLDVYTADSAWDQTVIYFDENGTPGLDNGLDAYKMFSYKAETPNLYNVSLDGKLSINALNSAIQTHSVPLGFRSSKTGQMSFSLNTTELDAKWFVYLEDKQLGIFYDIKANPYTFNHTQNSDSRFVLHFQTYGLSAEKLVSDIQNMSIGGDGTAVYVFVPAFYKDQNYQLEVIDMAGRVVYTDNKLSLNHGMNTLNLNLNANAYYAVRIKAAEGIVSGKVQIR